MDKEGESEEEKEAQMQRDCKKNDDYNVMAPIGSCLCEKTTGKLTKGAEPGQILVCQCSMCRTISGSTSVPYVAFRRKDIQLAERLIQFKSSPVASRVICPACGSFIAMDYYEENTLWLTLGALDKFDKEWIKKDRDYNMFSDSKADWFEAVCTLKDSNGYSNWIPDPCQPHDKGSPLPTFEHLSREEGLHLPSCWQDLIKEQPEEEDTKGLLHKKENKPPAKPVVSKPDLKVSLEVEC